MSVWGECGSVGHSCPPRRLAPSWYLLVGKWVTDPGDGGPVPPACSGGVDAAVSALGIAGPVGDRRALKSSASSADAAVGEHEQRDGYRHGHARRDHTWAPQRPVAPEVGYTVERWADEHAATQVGSGAGRAHHRQGRPRRRRLPDSCRRQPRAGPRRWRWGRGGSPPCSRHPRPVPCCCSPRPWPWRWSSSRRWPARRQQDLEALLELACAGAGR